MAPHCQRVYAYISKINSTDAPIVLWERITNCGSNTLVYFDSNNVAHFSVAMNNLPPVGSNVTIDGNTFRITELITTWPIPPPTIVCKKYWLSDIDPIHIGGVHEPLIPIFPVFPWFPWFNCCFLLWLILSLLTLKFIFKINIFRKINRGVNRVYKSAIKIIK